jgi:hypothetical protein
MSNSSVIDQFPRNPDFQEALIGVNATTAAALLLNQQLEAALAVVDKDQRDWDQKAVDAVNQALAQSPHGVPSV